VQAFEGFAHGWNVVHADGCFALHAAQQLGHLVVLLQTKINAVAFGAVVRRVKVKQAVWAVVFGDACGPVQVLNKYLVQPQVNGAQVLLDPQQIDAGFGRGGRAPGLALNFAAKG
jgi:hypothetical protein